MAILFIIIGILAIAVGAGILLHVVKFVIKAIIFAAISLSILILVAGVLIFFDARSFQAGFKELPSKYFLLEDGKIRAGLEVFPDGNFTPYDEENISAFNAAGGDLAAIKGDDFKVFQFDLVAFEGFMDGLNASIAGVRLNRTEVVAVLTGENSTRIISEKLYAGLDPVMRSQVPFEEFHADVRARLKSDTYVRSMVFARLLEETQGRMFVVFLAHGFRNGQVNVFPETFLFKGVRFIPESALRGALGG